MACKIKNLSKDTPRLLNDRWDWLKSETDNKVEWPCNECNGDCNTKLGKYEWDGAWTMIDEMNDGLWTEGNKSEIW